MSLFRYASEVEWYCTRGQTTFERSTAGYILERAATFCVKPVRDQEMAQARRNRKAHEPDPGDLTAQVTAETKQSGRTEPEIDALLNYGRVSRRLAWVAQRSATAELAIRLYHGDSGATTAMTGKGLGRIAAVIGLAPASALILAKSRQRKGSAVCDLSDRERIEREVAQCPESAPVKRAVAEAWEIYWHGVALYEKGVAALTASRPK